MKRISTALILCVANLLSFAQFEHNSLLWKIGGNGLQKPSYLFGTIHLLCKEDAFLSDNLKNAIKDADRVYLELDIDNLFEMLGAFAKMKMKNDTTLADLLTEEEYAITKNYLEDNVNLFPFPVLETFKPLLTTSLLIETFVDCDNMVAMETLIMEEAKKYGKRIDGLETMAYQMSIFDSIPYKVQARELYKLISQTVKKDDSNNVYQKMIKAYKEQNLSKLEELIKKSDEEMMQYDDILLYNRNREWVNKLKNIMKEKALVIAVGAGHLPGEKGVIQLLRKEGYTVTPVLHTVKQVREI